MRGVVEFVFEDKADGNPIAASSVLVGGNLMSIEEFISRLNEWETPIMFIKDMQYIWDLLEKPLKDAGYRLECTNKTTKDGSYIHAYLWTPKYQNQKVYEVKLSGEQRRLIYLRFPHFKCRDADKWVKQDYPMAKLTLKQCEFLDKISEDKDLPATPAAGAIGQNFSENKDFSKAKRPMDKSMYREVKMGRQGGVIYGTPGHYDIGYLYDITSLYPWAMCEPKRLPAPSSAEYIQEPEPRDPEYAYWINLYPESMMEEDPDRYNKGWHCNMDPSLKIIPSGSIKMLLCMPNDLEPIGHRLFDEKNNCERGTPAYYLAKLKLNGFIGKLIQRPRPEVAYHSLNGEKCWEPSDKDTDSIFAQHRYPDYTYIIEIARQRTSSFIRQAEAEGATVYQVNTDGFICDRPIKVDPDAGKTLGALRLDMVLHNLDVFAGNQYAADEKVCISGLPSCLYKRGKLDYEFYIFYWNEKKKRHEYQLRKVTLGGHNE